MTRHLSCGPWTLRSVPAPLAPSHSPAGGLCSHRAVAFAPRAGLRLSPARAPARPPAARRLRSLPVPEVPEAPEPCPGPSNRDTPAASSAFLTPLVCVSPAAPATILEDLDEQIYIITLEEEALQRRLNGLSSSVEYNITELEQELENVKTLKTKLERRKKASAWERNLVYPAVMVLLLTETFISVLLVACNILCLLVDETAMPKGTRGPGIGNASLSAFGFVGAALEIILIFYLMVSSVVGFYSLRFFGNFIPKKDDTTMTKIIGNCVSILVLSSALPVMSRTLGWIPWKAPEAGLCTCLV
uniref:Limb development membrane protein 1 n=1 Tax=Suricata suricatta TaxID=37032 RepID=A0A673TUW3_SURSU